MTFEWVSKVGTRTRSTWLIKAGVFVDCFGKPYVVAEQIKKVGLRGSYRRNQVWHLDSLPK